MSTYETKTADNFIFDESLDPRESLSNSTPFLKKNIIYVSDQQAGNGSYTSGEVIVDSSSAASSGNLNDWRNSYTVVPMVDTLTCAFSATGTITASATSAAASARFLVGSKNFCDLESVKVEANGKTIITATQGLEALCTFKMLCTSTQDSLNKDGAVINFWPDDVGQTGVSFTSYNAANAYTATGTTNSLGANRGLIERQQNLLPTAQTSFLSVDGVKNEGGCVDRGTGVFDNSVTTATTAQELHYARIIRHKDILDYFDKHGLSRGVGYRFTFKFNQAVSTVVYASTPSTTPFAAVPSSISISQTSGSKQPAMLCAGPGSAVAGLTLNNAATVTMVLTHAIDTTAYARINGIRTYIPSYELDPSHQEKLLAQPVLSNDFTDFMTQSTQTYAAPGAAINVQVSTSATNPRALIVIPRWSAAAATGSPLYGQALASEKSPVSTVPGSTDGLLSLINMQIKMGSEYVLPDRLNYGWAAFIDHITSIFALNGNQSSQTSGLITKKMWDANHRYYAFDLSRYPDAMKNLPQMISFEATNNSAVAIELQCYLVYGRNAERNLANGTLTVTA